MLDLAVKKFKRQGGSSYEEAKKTGYFLDYFGYPFRYCVYGGLWFKRPANRAGYERFEPDSLSTIQALGEQELNVKPRLVSHVENFEQYDVIFLGYPAWWMDVPIAIERFLEEYDFSGKTVIPLTTHYSSGLGSTVEKIQGLIPKAEVLSGISIQENALDSDRVNEILEKYLQ